MKKILSLLLVVIVVLTMAPAQVLAASNPYKDVTKRSVDEGSYTAIVYVKRHHGWSGGIIKKKRFFPNKYMTRQEFMLALYNLYGEKVPATVSDVIYANTVVTSAFVCSKCVALSSVLKYPIKWSGNGMKMKRKDVARYLKIFATYNSAFKPRK